MPLPIYLDRGGFGEPRLSVKYWYPSAAEGSGGVLEFDSGDRGSYVGENLGEVDPDPRQVDAERRSAAGVSRPSGRREKRLAGHAPGPQAVASGASALDKRDPRAELGGGLCADNSRGSTADDK